MKTCPSAFSDLAIVSLTPAINGSFGADNETELGRDFKRAIFEKVFDNAFILWRSMGMRLGMRMPEAAEIQPSAGSVE